MSVGLPECHEMRSILIIHDGSTPRQSRCEVSCHGNSLFSTPHAAICRVHRSHQDMSSFALQDDKGGATPSSPSESTSQSFHAQNGMELQQKHRRRGDTAMQDDKEGDSVVLIHHPLPFYASTSPSDLCAAVIGLLCLLEDWST